MTPTAPSEHRREPRFRHLVAVRIGNLTLRSANISLHGMQIVCPVMRFFGIEADVRRGQLSAQVTLPGSAPFSATLSVMYFSQYGDEMLVGVKAAVTDSNAQARWAAYIDDLSGAL